MKRSQFLALFTGLLTAPFVARQKSSTENQRLVFFNQNTSDVPAEAVAIEHWEHDVRWEHDVILSDDEGNCTTISYEEYKRLNAGVPGGRSVLWFDPKTRYHQHVWTCKT